MACDVYVAGAGMSPFRKSTQSIEELMADLGGDLKIVSEPGKGCTAILSAPFSVDDCQERD